RRQLGNDGFAVGMTYVEASAIEEIRRVIQNEGTSKNSGKSTNGDKKDKLEACVCKQLSTTYTTTQGPTLPNLAALLVVYILAVPSLFYSGLEAISPFYSTTSISLILKIDYHTFSMVGSSWRMMDPNF
ncbi:hypothetical protein BJ138DRAFT_1107456, partial [Hygrophoropsis aurantiaca]